MNYDKTIHPGMVSRYAYLRWCFDLPGSKTFIAVDNNNNIKGYGGILNIKEGNILLGPIYADSADIAKHLIVKSMSCASENCVLSFFGREGNPIVEELVGNLGMECDASSIRVQSKKEIELAEDKIFTCSMGGYSGVLLA